MSCFSEMRYSIYLDGELSAEERRTVETHLDSCARCRGLVEALRAETRFLAAALEEPEEVAAPAATRPLDLLWTAAAVLAAAAGLQGAVSWVGGATVPSAVEWLNPLSLSGQMNLLFSTLFYLVREGATMLVSSLTAVSILVFGGLIIGAGLFLVRRRPAALAVLVTLVVVLGLPQPGAAMEKRKGETITVASNETIENSLFASGDTVNVDGVINGDLFVFAHKLSIRGTVKGNVMAFTQSFDMNGKVEGNLYTFVQWFTLEGEVGRNLYAFCQNCRLTSGGRIGGDLTTFGQQTALDGAIGRDAVISGDGVEVRGTVGRNLTAKAHQVSVFSPARIGGNLSAQVHRKENLKVEDGATVVGKTETQLPKRREGRASRYARPSFYFGQMMRLAAAFATGVLLFWLFPALFPGRFESAGALLARMGIGLATLVAVPVGAVIVAITVIGLPIGILAVMAWVAGLYLAKAFVAIFVGQALMRPTNGKFSSRALALLVGLALLYVAMNLPYLGGLITFLVILLGLGMAAMQLYSYWRRPTPQPAG